MIENSILNVYPDFWLSNSSFGAYQYRIIRLARHDFQSEILSKKNSRVKKKNENVISTRKTLGAVCFLNFEAD